MIIILRHIRKSFPDILRRISHHDSGSGSIDLQVDRGRSDDRILWKSFPEDTGNGICDFGVTKT